MIDEGRAFYKCGSDTSGTGCVYGAWMQGKDPEFSAPRSVCVMCGKETEEEMQLWLSKGNLRLFVCPKCDAEMTAMAVKS